MSEKDVIDHMSEGRKKNVLPSFLPVIVLSTGICNGRSALWDNPGRSGQQK